VSGVAFLKRRGAENREGWFTAGKLYLESIIKKARK